MSVISSTVSDYANTYRYGRWGFTLAVPPDWHVEAMQRHAVLLMAFAPASHNEFRPNVNVTVCPTNGLSADEFLLLCRLQTRAASDSSRAVEDRLEQRAEDSRTFEWANAQTRLNFVQKVITMPGYAYIVTATSDRATFGRHRRLFFQIVDSFAVADEPAHSP